MKKILSFELKCAAGGCTYEVLLTNNNQITININGKEIIKLDKQNFRKLVKQLNKAIKTIEALENNQNPFKN